VALIIYDAKKKEVKVLSGQGAAPEPERPLLAESSHSAITDY